MFVEEDDNNHGYMDQSWSEASRVDQGDEEFVRSGEKASSEDSSHWEGKIEGGGRANQILVGMILY